MKFKITDIKNFVEASSCETIVEAAKKLDLSEPALTESIKRLESGLGAVVFNRSHSKLHLTASGKNFLFKATKALNSLVDPELSNEPEHIFAGKSISIGVPETVAQSALPKALNYLHETAPDYKIELKHGASASILEDIQNENIDIGIVINPLDVSGLVMQSLATDGVGVWAHKDLIESDTVIGNFDLPQTKAIFDKWVNGPKKIISTDSPTLVCSLVNEKIGFGILSERDVQVSGMMLQHQLALPSEKNHISMVYRPTFGVTKAEQRVIEALKLGMI